MKQDTSIEAFLDDFSKLTIDVSHRFYGGKIDSFYIKAKGYRKDCIIRNVVNFGDFTQYHCIVPSDLDLAMAYEIVENHGHSVPLQCRHVVRNPRFDAFYAYDGDDLGSHYSPEFTTFAVWAPTATRVVLELQVESKITMIEMQRMDKGVYKTKAMGDYGLATYVYYIHSGYGVVKTLDPYSVSSTANGDRSAVIDFSRIRKMKNHHLKPLDSAVDAIIYEMSIRDITSSPTSNTLTHGRFDSLMEKRTTYAGYPTAFDYVSSLGITHVQLLPISDFATVDEEYPTLHYNWGYDPLQYGCVEGSYASDPHNPYTRVNEFRMLVDRFHEHNIRVNLDVVYNHHYDIQKSAFDACVPFYYFRYTENGYPSNGSYCGNDVDSTRAMTRKYILDTLKMWINVYDVDGFRFDLMGILDIETMNAVVEETRKIKPDIMIYGEGWDLPTSLPYEKKATMANQQHMPEIGQFNDFFRDCMKGKTSYSESYAKGYITGDRHFIYQAMTSLAANCVNNRFVKLFESPHQSINYVECHDNQTSWDKMKNCCIEDVHEVRLQRQKMMIAIVLFAQGVPFIHCGQEYCRTKFGSHNSYNSDDNINQVDYERVVRYKEVVEFTKQCIALRKETSWFRLKTTEEIEKNLIMNRLNGDIIEVKYSDELIMYVNPFNQTRSIESDIPLYCIFDGNGKVVSKKVSRVVAIQPYSVMIYRKG